MSVFDRFRRSQKQSILPKEVAEYYKSEQRERASVAWVLGIVTLIVTLLLASALFFGGRWAYRKITNNEPSSSQTPSPSPASLPDGDEEINPPVSTPPTGSAPTPTPTTPNPAPATPNPSNPTPAPTPSVPSAGDASSLPRTGDDL